MAGHFRADPAPQSNPDSGLIIYPNGTGQCWLTTSDYLDPHLSFFIPPPLRAYIFACVAIRAVTLWVRPPDFGKKDATLVLAIAVKKGDGTWRTIAWQHAPNDETTARHLLAQHPTLTGACYAHDGSRVVNRDGSVQNMSDLLALTLTEFIEDAVAVPYSHQRRMSQP